MELFLGIPMSTMKRARSLYRTILHSWGGIFVFFFMEVLLIVVFGWS